MHDGVGGDQRLLHADGDAFAGERVDAGGVTDGDEARRGDRRRRLVAERGPAAGGARQRDAQAVQVSAQERVELAAGARDAGIVHEADVETVAVDGEDPEVAAQAVGHRRKIVEHGVGAPGAVRRHFETEEANRRAVRFAVEMLAHARADAVGADEHARAKPLAAALAHSHVDAVACRR